MAGAAPIARGSTMQEYLTEQLTGLATSITLARLESTPLPDGYDGILRSVSVANDTTALAGTDRADVYIKRFGSYIYVYSFTTGALAVTYQQPLYVPLRAGDQWGVVWIGAVLADVIRAVGCVQRAPVGELMP